MREIVIANSFIAPLIYALLVEALTLLAFPINGLMTFLIIATIGAYITFSKH